jgi:dGTPase
MDRDLVKKLEGCRGRLAGLRTPDEAAVRRRRDAEDEDGWMAGFGSPYAVDANKILCSKAIRRLSGKTQVVVLSRNRHTRDRLSHSFEVANAATTAARILGLNEDLCRAAGLGHDIGHTPFGHMGETMLTEMTGKKFRHEIFSAVIAQHIERKGAGLNLTRQVLRAFRNHSRGAGRLGLDDDMTAEESLVMYADKIAYVFADFNDLFLRHAVGTGGPRIGDHPKLAAEMAWFGRSRRERTFTALAHLCLESAAAGKVSFVGSEAAKRFAVLKDLMYEVYPRVNPTHLEPLLKMVYNALAELEPGVDPALVFALMNDQDVTWLVQRAVSGERVSAEDLTQLSVGDVLPDLRGQNIDFTDPDLDW